MRAAACRGWVPRPEMIAPRRRVRRRSRVEQRQAQAVARSSGAGGSARASVPDRMGSASSGHIRRKPKGAVRRGRLGGLSFASGLLLEDAGLPKHSPATKPHQCRRAPPRKPPDGREPWKLFARKLPMSCALRWRSRSCMLPAKGRDPFAPGSCDGVSRRASVPE